MNKRQLLVFASGLLVGHFGHAAVGLSGGSFDTNPILYETLSPNGTTFKFNLTGSNALVTVTIAKVENAADPGTVVASITQDVTLGNDRSIAWNGLWLIDGDLGRMAGKYRFSVHAVSGSDTADLIVNSPLLEINSLDIHGVHVTPSLDASGNAAFPYVISYSLAKSAKVTIKVLDNTSSVIRTLLNKQPRLSEVEVSSNTLSWDGLDDEGRPVPVEVYTLTFDAEDTASGDTATQRSRTIAVTSLAGLTADPQELFEKSVIVYPNPVRNNQAFFQFQPIRNNATVKLRIYTLTGDLIHEDTMTNLAAGNVLRFPAWNVTNQAGRKVGRGLYYYVVREEDPEGTLSVTKKMAVLP